MEQNFPDNLEAKQRQSDIKSGNNNAIQPTKTNNAHPIYLVWYGLSGMWIGR